MGDTIIIGGKEYKLVSVEKDPIVEEYIPKKVEQEKEIGLSGYPRAVPGVYDYRERYKQRKLTMRDVTAPPSAVSPKRMDSNLDQFGDLIWGPGIEQEM